ncbi:MAG: twin-arginine translocase TatA/TatE family subunit [Gemmatimonadales bacterium]|jgi:sec-independent protein translocase protein TatA|nr:MAG: twin-arginine translocase TatA/TatE family subunit [Gemmatimonadales bacterium]
MLGNIGFSELMILMVVVLLVFGAKRLPEIGSSLGRGIREFKRSISDAGDAINGDSEERTQLPRSMDAPPPSKTASGSGEPKRLSQ